MAPKRVGAWLIGAYGALATTVVVGAKAVARGLCDRTGLVTELAELRGLPLLPLDGLVFGGWDIRRFSVWKRAEELAARDAAIPSGLLPSLKADLRAIDREVRPGTAVNSGPAISVLADPTMQSASETLHDTVERLAGDLEAFRLRHRLDRVVVVNLASTEPPLKVGRKLRRLDDFLRLIRQDRRQEISPSVLYAYAALRGGFPYINFTPSVGASIPALHELALKHQVPFYGNDGKTGETLVKTVLAPLFCYRNLRVLSWKGYNILGGLDGMVLRDQRHKLLKVRSKERVLAGILGYRPYGGVSIEYVPSLGSWKTAWDFIHFEGFLGTRMSLQFIWQGCDAILAAPLVLDLIRLTEFAHRRGEAGPMTHLACFFKDPMGVKEHRFSHQWEILLQYVNQHRAALEAR